MMECLQCWLNKRWKDAALKPKTSKMKSTKKKANAAGKALEEQRVKFEEDRKVQAEKFLIQKSKVEDDLRAEISVRVRDEGNEKRMRVACMLLRSTLGRRKAAHTALTLRGWAVSARAGGRRCT